MRILLAVPDMEGGGVEAVFRSLCLYLRDRGNEVFVFHLTDDLILKRYTSSEGFESFALRLQPPSRDWPSIVRTAAFLALVPIALAQLFLLLRRLRIQIVNIHYPNPADDFFYFAFCRRMMRFSLVTSIHGADVFPGGKSKPSYSARFRTIFHSSDLIVAPSHAFKEQFLDVFPSLRPRTVFIHNGIRLPETHRLSSGFPLKPNALKRYILSVSALKHAKALDILIRAFAHIHEENPDLNLVLVGEGNLRRDLEDLARRLNLANSVEFPGRLVHERVLSLVAGCEVFVLPSRFETFGIAVLEAMAFHKPVVATKVGGIPEIVQDGLNGILVPPDDDIALANALRAVLVDVDFRTRLSNNAYTTVRSRFDVSTMGAAYADAYTGSLPSGQKW